MVHSCRWRQTTEITLWVKRHATAVEYLCHYVYIPRTKSTFLVKK